MFFSSNCPVIWCLHFILRVSWSNLFCQSHLCYTALRQLNFEVVHHRQAFQSPYQNLLKSAVKYTLLASRGARGLSVNGLIWILRLIPIVLYSFCSFSQADVFVVCVLIYIYLTLFTVESWVWKTWSSGTSHAAITGSKKTNVVLWWLNWIALSFFNLLWNACWWIGF